MSNKYKFETVVVETIYRVYEFLVPEDDFVDGVYRGSWEGLERLEPKREYKDKYIADKKFIGVVQDD